MPGRKLPRVLLVIAAAAGALALGAVLEPLERRTSDARRQAGG